MFKSILPSSRRSASVDINTQQLPTESQTGGKENRPQHPLANVMNAGDTPRPASFISTTHKKVTTPLPSPKLGSKGAGRLVEAGAMNRAFEQMLEDMQIPSTLRPKLITLDSPVKAAMLKSSQTLSITNPVTPTVRKSKSSDSVSNSPKRPFGHAHTPSLDGVDPSEVLAPPRPLSGNFGTGSSFGSATSESNGQLSRNGSVEFLPALTANPHGDNQADGGSKSKTGKQKSQKDKGSKDKSTKEKEKELSAEAMSLWLGSTKSTQLEVERLKRLRLLLRNESATWSEVFLRQGGYSALLTRLNELLEVEWREEQHDDQALHELLRCFKALSTSSIGCFALRSSCPTPFAQLVKLLYSDKKPGEVATRQLVVDLLLILYELYPSENKANADSESLRGRSTWEVKGSGHVIPPARPTVFVRPDSPPPPLPAPHSSIFSLIRAILLTPKPAPSDSPSIPVDPHAFIASLHLPRIYKTYLQEMADVRRDYFWIFCHPNNTIWDLDLTDEERVEKPRAPGGMTGGVEYEAITYLTTHFRLLNTLARAAAELCLPPTEEQSAYKFHSDLFQSGLEKIILTARKASTTYYPNLHLEIGRYIKLAGQAKYELPWSISRYIGPPPAALLRQRPLSFAHSRSSSVPRPSSPIPPLPPRRPADVRPPSLPPPRRMDDIKI